MTIEELKSQLASRGFNFSKAVYDTGVEWYAYRKLETPWNCTCNEKAPALCIYPWDTHGIFSAEFEVVGEVSGENWLKLQCYAVPLDECLDSLARIERILTAAWNAASLAEPELAVRLSDEEMCNLSESILTTKKTGLSYIPCGVIELGRAIEAAVLKKNGLE